MCVCVWWKNVNKRTGQIRRRRRLCEATRRRHGKGGPVREERRAKRFNAAEQIAVASQRKKGERLHNIKEKTDLIELPVREPFFSLSFSL
jgi:hypothetical protein